MTTPDTRHETRNTRRTALVTGGSRGIGLGIATALAREGFDLAVGDVRDEAASAEALAKLRTSGREVLYVQADISKTADRQKLVAVIRERYGQLNVLVNNAGIAPRVRRDLLEATEESFDEVLGVNLRGPYFLTQLAARWMIEQKKTQPEFAACIINISSVSATMASTGRGEYCISKAGLSMATQLWATRLGEFGIPVFEMRPGIIKTDMTAAVQAKYDKLIAEGLLVQPRWGTPDDVGRAVALLARGEFPYSTGQVIMVDGGLTLPRL